MDCSGLGDVLTWIIITTEKEHAMTIHIQILAVFFYTKGGKKVFRQSGSSLMFLVVCIKFMEDCMYFFCLLKYFKSNFHPK